MEIGSVKRRKKQGNITRIAVLIAVGLHVAAYFFLFHTKKGNEYREKIMEIVQTTIAPPPPPPPPPPPAANMKSQAMDMTKMFAVTNTAARMDVKNDFDAKQLNSFSSGGDEINLNQTMMDMSSNDTKVMVSNQQLAPIAIGENIGFSITSTNAGNQSVSANGEGQRTTGKLPLSILDIRGDSIGNPWRDGELENIAEYISTNTSVKAELGARAISFVDEYSSFDNWVNVCKQRAPSDHLKDISGKDPEIDVFELLANAIPYLSEKEYEKYRNLVRKIMTAYFTARYRQKLNPESQGWAGILEKEGATLPEWAKTDYFPEAEKSFIQTFNAASPNGSELRGIYNLLRISEIMKLPILFCDPRGNPEVIQPENERFLRTYINNGGFIYFINAAGFNKCNGVRGLIAHLIQETIDDPVGKKTLFDIKKHDRQISGYTFYDPDPQIFHPWTFFGMILPRQTNVNITIFNKFGAPVFLDTLKNLDAGAHTQRTRDYKWFAVDNQGNEVESGYYIYKIESDLCVKTGPLRVSRLRRLPNGKHRIFSSFYNISNVPTKEAVNPSELPYGDMNVFGVSDKGRLAICYTEGYKEKSVLGKSANDPPAQNAALKWVTNVVIYALSEGSLAR